MICTSVVPCLSRGLAKNDKILSSMFVLFHDLFSHFESLAILQKWGGGGNLIPMQSDRMFLADFSKVQQLNNNFFLNCGYFG